MNLEFLEVWLQHFEEDLNKLTSALEDHAYLHTDQMRMKEAVDEVVYSCLLNLFGGVLVFRVSLIACNSKRTSSKVIPWYVDSFWYQIVVSIP